MDATGAAQGGVRDSRIRGRGAVSKASGRFERETREAFDDGWTQEEPLPAQLATEIREDTARSIIASNNSPDLSFSRSINPYRGCEHGCIYCYARPSHAFLGLSPGLDFETKLYAKHDGAALLEAAFRKPGYVPESISLGANTDPYQPIERRLEITRGLLEVMARFRHPVALVTKSGLIARDTDLLGPMARDGLAKAAVSLTSLDRKLSRKMEPRAAAPEKRLETIARLSEAGIPVIVMVAPIIPGLNDHEIEAILEAARDAGAVWANYVLLRLPLEIATLFQEWLAANVPDRASRVMSLVRQTRGGKDYDARWHTRQTGTGPYARLIARRFRQARRRYGLDTPRTELRTDLFRVPPRPGDQLALL